VRLATALRLQPAEVVAFVGGGGKTSSMFLLADEIVAAGGRVVTTTTTRIFAAQISLAPRHRVADDTPLAELEAVLAETGHVLVTGPIDQADGKAFGVAPEWIERLQGLAGNPTILVEADGSRMRPFKAPAGHEPVIPPNTTLVVPVVGADVFGAPLSPERVHRADLVAALAAARLGEPVTPELVAAVIGHPHGGLKGVPPSARVIPMINKVESEAQRMAARQTAAALLANERISAVVLGAVRRESPAEATYGRAAAIVLAAGSSTRMGMPKQLLPWGDLTLVGAVVRALQASDVAAVVVVTGREREAVEAAVAAARLPNGAPVMAVFNPDFAQGEMALSLQVGLAALPANCLAAVVALADQPELRPELVDLLLQRWRQTQAPVIAPLYLGRRGHPIVFDRVVWPEIMALPPQANPRRLLQSLGRLEAVPVEDASILIDLDTPEDYSQALARRGGPRSLV
jgi:molybdenum cofactor cytidylyltransferase